MWKDEYTFTPAVNSYYTVINYIMILTIVILLRDNVSYKTD